MGHFTVDKYREKKTLIAPPAEPKELEGDDEMNGGLDDTRGTIAEAADQSSEKSLQPDGGDDGIVSGESNGGDGADAEQTDTADDATGLGNDEAKAKPKSGTKRV